MCAINILHINTNYEVSSIYPNMLYELNNLPNVSGRLYYPSSSKKNISDKNAGFIDKTYCLKKHDRYFFFRRNKKLLKDVTSIYNFKQYDLVLAYSLFSNGYLAYTLKKKFSIPYIVIVQNTDINFYFKRMLHLRKIGRKILNEAEKVIFISQPYKDMILKKYIKDKDYEMLLSKSEVIPFGIDDFWFENKINNKLKNKNNKLRILYVGKINKNKNIISSAKACEKLLKQGKDVTFTIVGEIKDQKLFKKLRKYKFINYIPFISMDKLLEVYRNNDIFVMPSIKESFGLVYAEAMSQGLPVVYTKGQGFDKHFDDGKIGYSVIPTSINDIANTIVRINDNYEYFSENCLLLVEKFQWKNIAKYYHNIFQEILNLTIR